MTKEDRNKLGELLLRYSLDEVRPHYVMFVGNKNVEAALEMAKLDDCIKQVFESIR